MKNFYKKNKNLLLGSSKKILDVGTGGFLGINTLEHYINDFTHENIYCLEYKENLYNNLVEKYKNTNINFFYADYFTKDFDVKFDLIILDICTQVFLTKFDVMIEKAKTLLNEGGYIILVALGKLEHVNLVTKGNKDQYDYYASQYKEHWKTEDNITDEMVSNRLKNDFKYIDSAKKNDLTRYILYKKN